MDENTQYHNAVNALGQLIQVLIEVLKKKTKKTPQDNQFIGKIIRVHNEYRDPNSPYTSGRFQEVLAILNELSNLPIIDSQLKEIVSEPLYTKIKAKVQLRFS